MSRSDRFRAALIRLRDRVAAISGWRARGLATVFGAVAATAFPPVHLVILLIPAFVGWLWMIEGTSGWRRAFGAGWWFGLGHFTAGLYWITNALLVYPERFGWLVPFAILGLSGGFAVFPALAAAVVRLLPVDRPGRLLALALAWSATEWLRTWVLTGFPWNLVGTAWSFSPAALQPAALFGVLGLGLITVFVALLPALLAEERLSVRRAGIGVVAGFAVIAVLWAGGGARLADATSETVPDVRLRLVQPNIPQKLKWHPDLRDKNLVQQVILSRQPAVSGAEPTVVIWPETSATFFLATDKERRGLLAKAAPAGGLVIAGAPRRSPPGQPYGVWNSLHAVDPDGHVLGTYDKAHLVPFGEYIPLRSLLAGVPKITEGRQDFSPGRGLSTLRLPGLPPFSPLICYEVIFPGAVARDDDRPAWILNLTNDAWYGYSSGPFQHLAAAQMRAVEEGLPLVRVATTGISAVFDAYGRKVAELELEQAGNLDTSLPTALPPTLFARYGNATVLPVALTVVVVWVLVVGVPGRRRRG